MLVFITNQHIFQCLPYLILFPKYSCPPEKPDCTYEDNCRDPTLYPVDWNNELSLHNWVEKLNLQCDSPYNIALMGSMYFAGSLASGIVVTRIADLYGRKWCTIIGTVASIPIHIAMILSNSLLLNIVLFFILGTTRPSKSQVGFVFVSELVPEKFRRIVGSFLLFCDGSSLILFALYFLYISK